MLTRRIDSRRKIGYNKGAEVHHNRRFLLPSTIAYIAGNDPAIRFTPGMRLSNASSIDLIAGFLRYWRYCMIKIDDSFGYWLAGLTDGEGCFHARAHIRKRDGAHTLVAYFAIKMRADDISMLQRVMDILDVGKIYIHDEKLSKWPQADYHVVHRYDLANVIIPLFDMYPLQSKKQRDYAIWRKIVLDYKCAPRQHCQVGIGALTDKQWGEACELTRLLSETRAFDPATAELARQRVANTQPPLPGLITEQLEIGL